MKYGVTLLPNSYDSFRRYARLAESVGFDYNTIIRQLYFPFRQWQQHTDKPVTTLFLQRNGNEYHLWHFGFNDPNDYNSIRLLNSARYRITRAG